MTNRLKSFYHGLSMWLFGWAVRSRHKRPWVRHIPNLLTLSRISMFAVVGALLTSLRHNHLVIAGLWLVLVGILFLTDAVDGPLARAMGSAEQWQGKMMDAGIDKVAVDGSLLVLLAQHIAPLGALLTSLIIARIVLDATLFLITLFQALHGNVPGAGEMGKIKFHYDTVAVLSLCLANFWPHGSWASIMHAVALASLVVACGYAILSLAHHLKPSEGARP